MNCSPDWPKVHISKKKIEHNPKPFDTNLLPPQRRKRDTNTNCNMELPMTFVESATGVKTYSISVSSSLHLNAFTDYAFHLQFIMTVPTMDEEGLYNLYFHACPNYKEPLFSLNFDVSCVRSCFYIVGTVFENFLLHL